MPAVGRASLGPPRVPRGRRGASGRSGWPGVLQQVVDVSFKETHLFEQLGAGVLAHLSGVLLGGIYALLSVGFGLTWGTMKVLNISHAVFAVLGAFVAYWLFVKAGVDPILSLPLLVALLFLVGAVVYKLVIRPVTRAKDVIMASMVATFGVAIVVENVMSYGFSAAKPGVLRIR